MRLCNTLERKMNRDELEKQIIQDFKETFNTEHGQRVLARLANMSTLNRSSASPDKGKVIDVNRLIYDEGQRAVLLYINKQLNKDLGKVKQKGALDGRGS